MDRHCFTTSSGNAPGLDLQNRYHLLSDTELSKEHSMTECNYFPSSLICTTTQEGVTPHFDSIRELNPRDSTPTFISSSQFSHGLQSPKITQNIKPQKKVKIEIPKTKDVPTSTIPTIQVPDGQYLSEYLSSSFVVGSYYSSHLYVPIILGGIRRSRRATAMIDSGATALFMHRKYAEKHGMLQQELPRPISVHNIDGTLNKSGSMTHFVRLQLTAGDYKEMAEFLITDIGPEEVILGLPWLRRVNPDIDWASGKMVIGEAEKEFGIGMEEDGDEMEPDVYQINASRTVRKRWVKEGITDIISDEVWCAAGYTHSQRIAEEAAKAKNATPKTFEEQVPESYHMFKHVFSEQDSQRLPEHQPWDHKIDLKPEAPDTLRSKVYPMSYNEEQELDNFLKEQLDKGYIKPSKSPMSSPVFFIKKKDGKLRLIQDYRKLNEYTVKNRYPLPLAQDIINRLRGAKVFSKMDVRWGYYNIRIAEGDEWKAAFTTSRGLFEPNVMFFGLTNAPATFQALMNTIFADLVAKGKVAVYLDDILVFTQTIEEHREVVREVLSRLQKHDLYLRPEKCEFERDQVEYLGLVIKEGKVSMDPAKVKAVTEWPTPRNLKDVRSFVGFANFYRRFIKDFARIARPLHNLTKKDVAWRWDMEEQDAFDRLKEAFTSEPVLVMWSPDSETRVETDASGSATGGALLQKKEDGLWHPVAYRSESMTEAERNYEIYDREMLGIVRALEDWRHFLEGLPEPFMIHTDHLNLEHWKSPQNLNRRQARWHLYLSRFDYRIMHKPGKTMHLSDPLSRQFEVKDSDDNQGITVLKPEHFIKSASVTLAETPLETRIREASIKEADVIKSLRNLVRSSPRSLSQGIPDWEEIDGLTYYQNKLYIPKKDNLRLEVLKLVHDHPAAGHPGRNGTYELVSEQFWWPNMSTMVAKYVEGCDRCARMKEAIRPSRSVVPLEVPSQPWEVIGVDLIGPLPECKGYNAILTYVDHYSGQVKPVPCRTDITAEGVGDMHFKEIFPEHGLPKKFVSDRGPQFASRAMRALLKRLGIEGGLTTAYHPRANGKTERMNREISKHIRLYCNRRGEDWVDWIPTLTFAINSRKNSSSGYAPFELMYGFKPTSVQPVGTPSRFPSVEARLKSLEAARKDAEAAMRMSKKEQSREGEVEKRKFEVGERVWLDAKPIQIKGVRKLTARKLGPYKVIKQISPVNYELDLPKDLRVHPVFHIDRLSPWKGNEVNGKLPPPPEPVEVEGEEEYEVEEVLDSKVVGKGLRYLVKWKGYDEGENSWQPAGNLTNAQAKVKAFHKKNPSAPRPVGKFAFASYMWHPIEHLTDNKNPRTGQAWEIPEWENGKLKGKGE